MKLEKIKDILQAEVKVGAEYLQKEVKMAGGSDLMSDVLSFMKPGSLLLTGLINPQSVRTAEMAEIVAVCYVRGKKPLPETVELAKEKGIPLLLTQFTMFEACGKLYQRGLPGRVEYKGG
ncbi:hypothetical protein ES703_16150 [subsurface metagenome]|nr:hypothetical protein [candidate division WOR-3 bacterium]